MNNGLSTDEIKKCELMGVNRHLYIETREHERREGLGQNQEGQSVLESKIAKMMDISPGEARAIKEQVDKEETARAPLTEDELRICRQLGVEPLDYWAQKMADAGLKAQLG